MHVQRCVLFKGVCVYMQFILCVYVYIYMCIEMFNSVHNHHRASAKEPAGFESAKVDPKAVPPSGSRKERPDTQWTPQDVSQQPPPPLPPFLPPLRTKHPPSNHENHFNVTLFTVHFPL